MAAVHYRYSTVQGHRLFYREAGPADAPVIVLLHGFPASSFMFRDLIPPLAQRYRVIAPDLLGFGLSDAPAADTFTYTLDALSRLTAGLLTELGVTRAALTAWQRRDPARAVPRLRHQLAAVPGPARVPEA